VKLGFSVAEPHRLVGINYAIRAGSFACCFAVLGLHGWEQGYGATFWTLLALQFLAYPHLAWLRARAARDGKETEIQNMYLDATLLGAWMGAMHFPLWITYALMFSTTLNAASVRGVQGMLASLASFCVGAALAIAAAGLQFSPETSDTVTLLCFLGSLAYSAAIGNVMYTQSRRYAAARDDKLRSEARYRLLAENAGDLIALVDTDGRWLYVSPSYEGLLDAKDLEHGADAFRRVHPDDADRARLAVLRAAATAKGRELPLRLVDRDGRVRQLRMRVQPVSGDSKTIESLVLISQDVTDLRASEERVRLAAHALEGMTEAIVITAADGTVVTVNRAFTETTGYTRDEVLGSPEKSIRNALQPPEFYDEVYAAVQRDGYWSGTTWSRRKNGSVYREWRSIRAVRNDRQAVTHYVIVFYEVGAPRERQDEAQKA
jgi:PAS domain S-box-containing protein